ncbi:MULTISPECIES: acyl-CoA dehydrogenase family protein [Nocardiaceae]|uniref:Acyl-CoA dehydrogenase n=1 Tax=Rhodococcoides corynebacterioides TaxID=53972 RepID=A0ABS2KN13_9NOCA|nr:MULTISPECIES: acyl-CoA dehydrogenase family protein [Rhodococcus]MBM7413370.1 acyl-CoA dehydrogenase [Rhodococcus corynebacterioides]MBP1115833.1 acyl-CoA dehydrogenase [Rhodococcus sp. PvP016]
MSAAIDDVTYSPWPEVEPAGLVPGPEQTDLRSAVRAVLARHGGLDEGTPWALWRTLVGDMAVTMLSVPEDRGGLGYGMTDMAVVLEECGRGLVSEPVLFAAGVGVHALLRAPAGTVDALVSGALAGELRVAVHLPVSQTRRTAARMITADHTADGWRLSGVATDIVHAASAEVVVVEAHTAEGSRLFAVPLSDAVRAVPRTVVDPTRPRADVHLDAAAAHALTEVADTASVLDDLTARATIGLASEHTGIADRMLEMTVEYVTTRQQFGRPVGSFQAVKHRLADLMVSLERARSASRFAAAVYDSTPDRAALAVAIAGAVCTEVASESVAEAVQLHGGVGFTWEHQAHRYFRRATGDEALLGDAVFHRRRVAELVGLNSVRQEG